VGRTRAGGVVDDLVSREGLGRREDGIQQAFDVSFAKEFQLDFSHIKLGLKYSVYLVVLITTS
jgi:hypothetical protein